MFAWVDNIVPTTSILVKTTGNWMTPGKTKTISKAVEFKQNSKT